MATFISNSVEETIAFARAWARTLQPNDVVAWSAISARAKRISSKVCSRAWRARRKRPARPSPSSTNIAAAGCRFFISISTGSSSRRKSTEIGFDDYLEEGGVSVIEWADRFPQVLPARTRWLRIEVGGDRNATITEENEMKVLALELSSPVGSVAFCDDGGDARLSRSFPADRKDSGFFYENLQRGLSEAMDRPNLIVVGLGPGLLCRGPDRDRHRAWSARRLGARLRGLPSICAFDPRGISLCRRRAAEFVFLRARDRRPLSWRGRSWRARRNCAACWRNEPDLPVLATRAAAAVRAASWSSIRPPCAWRNLRARVDGASEEMLEPIYLRAPLYHDATEMNSLGADRCWAEMDRAALAA